MKKFFFAAVMALTTLFATNCTGLTGAKQPVIDEENHTVNGVQYDDETYYCWKFEWETTTTYGGLAAAGGSEHDSGVDYYWWTEFDAQSYKAEWDYANNQKATVAGASVKLKGTSKLTKLDNVSSSECYDLD